MKLIRQISESTMVYEFVAAEWESARFGSQTHRAFSALDLDLDLIEKPKLKSQRENGLRARVLESCRGYTSRTLNFNEFPERTKWFRAEFTLHDFEMLQYIEDRKNWNRLSKGTRYVRDGCSYIHSMSKSSDPARFVRSIFKAIKSGKELPPIIVVTDPKRSRLVILEGACRSTAYYRAFQEGLVRKVKTIVGVSSRMDEWRLF